ncbi:hypothetical protein BJX76DRAFT_343050 [Aspergillus varians]
MVAKKERGATVTSNLLRNSLPASCREGQPAAPMEDQEYVVTPHGQGSSADAAGSTTVEAPRPPPGFVEISFWTFEGVTGDSRIVSQWIHLIRCSWNVLRRITEF